MTFGILCCWLFVLLLCFVLGLLIGDRRAVATLGGEVDALWDNLMVAEARATDAKQEARRLQERFDTSLQTGIRAAVDRLVMDGAYKATLEPIENGLWVLVGGAGPSRAQVRGPGTLRCGGGTEGGGFVSASWWCLSVRQPWAWLIVQGWKNIENRNWATKFRGRFLVHAAKGMTRGDYDACRIFVSSFCTLELPEPTALERGGIVGSAVLLDCVTHHASEWFVGSHGFVLDEQKPMPFVPCRGALGFFKLPVDVAGLVVPR